MDYRRRPPSRFCSQFRQRSAAGRALDEDAIARAVIASVRHENTDYDSLLMSGVPREIARDRVRADIDRLLSSWTGATSAR